MSRSTRTNCSGHGQPAWRAATGSTGLGASGRSVLRIEASFTAI